MISTLMIVSNDTMVDQDSARAVNDRFGNFSRPKV